MFAARIEEGIVTQVAMLGRGRDAPAGWVASETRVGIGWSYDGSFAPPAAETPEPEPVTIAPKLALMRALRLVQLDGTPMAEGQTSAWTVVKTALAASSEALQEDWQAVNRIPRDDPIMLAFTAGLPWPQGTDPNDVIDAVYELANGIDRGLIDLATGREI